MSHGAAQTTMRSMLKLGARGRTQTTRPDGPVASPEAHRRGRCARALSATAVPQCGRKGVTLKKHKGAVVSSLLVLAAVSAGSALAGPTTGSRIVPFTASYAGAAVVTVTDNVADISANGAGKGAPIGVGKVTGVGKGDSSQQPCVPFTGTGSLAGTKGTVNFKVLPASSGCGDEGGHNFTISAKTIVTGGTKAFEKAKGPLKLTGIYDRDAGTFTVKFSGKLTLPK